MQCVLLFQVYNQEKSSGKHYDKLFIEEKMHA